jgi:hypothetical protein
MCSRSAIGASVTPVCASAIPPDTTLDCQSDSPAFYPTNKGEGPRPFLQKREP